jgi:hypothetical protein
VAQAGLESDPEISHCLKTGDKRLTKVNFALGEIADSY